MLGLIWSQLRFRRGRSLLLGSGILVAAASFTLLTSAATTGRLQVRETVTRNYRPAYDILVRPPGSATELERSQGLVRQNYLSGIYGGITTAQWRRVLGIPGVAVAAPIANVGYVMLQIQVPVPLDGYLQPSGRQLYRVGYTWRTDRGLSAFPGPQDYVYYTTNYPFIDPGRIFDPKEVIPGRDPLPVCAGYRNGNPDRWPNGPFDLLSQSGMLCFSKRSPGIGAATLVGPGALAQDAVDMYFPVLLSAIDPVQENRLIGFDRTVVAGRTLRAGEGVRSAPFESSSRQLVVPVLASTRDYLDQTLQVQVQRLAVPAGVDLPAKLATPAAFAFVRALPGRPVGTQTVTPGPVYQATLGQLATMPDTRLLNVVAKYWTTSPPVYRRGADGVLRVLPTTNPTTIWTSSLLLSAPPGANDTQFRALADRTATTQGYGNLLHAATLQLVGRFDPARLPGFSPLSKVPLETYYPPEVLPGDGAAARALGGRSLAPNTNLGGYLAQPPGLLTTLSAVSTLTRQDFYPGPGDDEQRGAGPVPLNARAPISVIRVRVAGVSGPDPVSRERIRRVAEAIVRGTGLTVDVTAGSSPHPLNLVLPAGRFGRPALSVTEGWVQKNAAVVILTAIDRKSAALFGLILLVAGFFLANGSVAAVRARRAEIGVLRCLGWPRGRIFRLVLGELVVLGAAAGLAGTALAAALAGGLALRMPLAQVLLVTPVAVLLAGLAGLVPAWAAGRGDPTDALAPPVTGAVHRHRVRSLPGLAAANLRRVPGRTALAALALAVGIAAFTVLLSLNLAFGDVVSSTLLGTFSAHQVRGVDYLSVGLAIGLGALSVVDLLWLNLRERAAELATLRAVGWQAHHLARVTRLEGLGVGLTGSLTGAAVGLAATAALGGQAHGMLTAATLAATAGTLLTLLTTPLAVHALHRLPITTLLAED